MNYDYAVHSDFLIHWTGKDIDEKYDKDWHLSDKSKMVKNSHIVNLYIKRLHDILKHGLWMTEEQIINLIFNGNEVSVPPTPKTCFTELKVSESRKHARKYGRLGIGVKRPFVFSRFGRPLAYYGFHEQIKMDKFLKSCAMDLSNKELLNYFKPMNSTTILNYDYYAESEWRIIFFKELLDNKLIIDPANPDNIEANSYYKALDTAEQNKLKYLIPLDGWFAMIIHPSLSVKNRAQQDPSTNIRQEIARIKNLKDRGNSVEDNNWPIEVDLDACRNF